MRKTLYERTYNSYNNPKKNTSKKTRRDFFPEGVEGQMVRKFLKFLVRTRMLAGMTRNPPETRIGSVRQRGISRVDSLLLLLITPRVYRWTLMFLR